MPSWNGQRLQVSEQLGDVRTIRPERQDAADAHGRIDDDPEAPHGDAALPRFRLLRHRAIGARDGAVEIPEIAQARHGFGDARLGLVLRIQADAEKLACSSSNKARRANTWSSAARLPGSPAEPKKHSTSQRPAAVSNT